MDGVLIINKPKKITSFDVVHILRKELNIKKIGHTGTLDPNATGVLLILIGKATKIAQYLLLYKKTYIAQMKLGETTDTLDSEGKILQKQKVKKYTQKEIVDVLDSFLGKQMQTPPQYSAIKVNGRKAYDYARSGQEVYLEPREIEIYSIKLLSYKEDVIEFQVECSKGTYIRSLCKDIATKLGTISYVQELERTAVDCFTIENAIKIDDIKNKTIDVKKYIISIEDVFQKNEKIFLSENELKPFINGVKLKNSLKDGIYRTYLKDKFIGLGIVKEGLLKRSNNCEL